MAYTGRALPLVPPDKGSFPLDHQGACKAFKQVFLECLRANKGVATACRPQSLEYLKCRMDKGLMAPESLEGLGFAEGKEPMMPANPLPNPTDKEKTGFLAGLTVKPILPS